MEKERGSRIIAIIALVVAVAGLTLGFAAFTKDLNITFSESNVNLSGDLDVQILASDNVDDPSTTVDGIGYSMSIGGLDETIIVNSATISSDRTIISGLGGTFSNKYQSIMYMFQVYNNSEYDAYLKSVDFLDYIGADTNKVCTALEGTTQSLVDAACEDVHVLVAIGDVEVMDTSESGFSSVKVAKGETEDLMLFIVYGSEEMDDSTVLPNGNFKINFGGIKLNFSSLV